MENITFNFRMMCNGASFLLTQTDKIKTIYNSIDMTALCVGCEYSLEIVIRGHIFDFQVTNKNKEDVLQMLDFAYLVRGGK